MTATELHELLRRLHAELARAESLDGESRRLLDVVLEDVRRVGAGGGTPPATAGGLEALAVRFEAEHPQVAGTLRQVADLLGKAGI
jgi:hypothetical protein